jgi:hypothetical protein
MVSALLKKALDAVESHELRGQADSKLETLLLEAE